MSAVRDRVMSMLFGLLLASVGQAQIGPPGMGEVRLTGWAAVGATQRLDTAGTWQWSGYLGHGRSAAPDGGTPWQRPAILVIDQLVTYRLAPHWQLGLGASFRSQWRYASEEPFEPIAPVRDEERLHARVVLQVPLAGWRMQVAVKEELRRFCTPDLKPWDQDVEWRNRLKLQADHDLDAAGMRKVVLSMEEPFAMDHQRQVADAWTALGYRETRLAAYLVQRLAHGGIDLSFGGMADLVRGAHPAVGPYVVTSLAWRDPFHRSVHRS